MNITQSNQEIKGDIPIIFDSYVINNEDKFGSGEIRVRIDNIDSEILDDDLPPCYPLLPLHLNIIPKVGERVRIMFARIQQSDEKGFQNLRLYFGSVISNPANLNFDPFHYSSNSFQPDGFIEGQINPNSLESARGLYPTQNEIALQGRNNADLVFKDREVLLRAGKYNIGDPLIFNKIDPAYIQIKHGLPELTESTEVQTINKTVITPPLHEIIVTDSGNNVFVIEVKSITTNEIVFTKQIGEQTRDKTVIETRKSFRNLIETYDRYSLNTIIPELSDIPVTFPNASRLVKETVEVKKEKVENTDSGSVINIIATKINLKSHNGTKNLNVTSQPDYIKDTDQIDINSKLHPVAYGDVLVDFLKLMQSFVANHTHPYPNVAPTQKEVEKNILNFDLDSLLSKNLNVD